MAAPIIYDVAEVTARDRLHMSSKVVKSLERLSKMNHPIGEQATVLREDRNGRYPIFKVDVLSWTIFRNDCTLALVFRVHPTIQQASSSERRLRELAHQPFLGILVNASRARVRRLRHVGTPPKPGLRSPRSVVAPKSCSSHAEPGQLASPSLPRSVTEWRLIRTAGDV